MYHLVELSLKSVSFLVSLLFDKTVDLVLDVEDLGAHPWVAGDFLV